jgi:hypothetical protein
VLPIAAAMLLAACADDPAQVTDSGIDDPALSGALADAITIDPDLAGQNGAAAVASHPSLDGSVPSLDTSPAAISRARSDALALVGGSGAMRKAPTPRQIQGALPAEAALSAAARAAHSPGAGDCAGKVEYTAAWAARLPDAFPVYPRGAVQEAAGTDAPGCSLRVVNFLTPVPVGEVMDFYFTRASKAGFSTQAVLQEGDTQLGGVKGGASYTVYARTLPSGATEVDLVTSNG